MTPVHLLVLAAAAALATAQDHPSLALGPKGEDLQSSGLAGFGAELQSQPYSYGTSSNAKRCSNQNQCPDNETCRGYKCVDPCIWCGENTMCIAANHKAECTCKKGYVGDPYAGCEKLQGGCDAECTGHDHCPSHLACVRGKCSDPCEGLCGANATCQVTLHMPSCACAGGHRGNPFTGCNLLDTVSVCGDNVWPPTTGKKRFYVESAILAAWHEAWINCFRNGSRLASIDTKEELDLVKDELNKAGRRVNQFWTSGSDHGSGLVNKFTWISTGKPVRSDVAEWHPGQPDNWATIEDCIELWEIDKNVGFKWNDRNCVEKHYYICEYYDK